MAGNDYTITIDGIPWRVRGSTRDRAETEAFYRQRWASLPDDVKQQKAQGRIEELKKLGVDLDRNYATEGMGAGEKFLVGAGRTYTRLGRGIGQRVAERMDDPKAQQWLNDSRRTEMMEAETFAMLDNEGFGWEDIGEIAPEMAAFIGTGGVAGFAARGAMLGAADATEEGESVGLNALVGGVAAGLGGALGKTVAAGLTKVFKPNAQFSAAQVKGIAALLKGIKNPAQATQKIVNFLRQADTVDASASKALREVGDQAYGQARMLVQQMNAIGRESVFRQNLNQTFQRALKTNADGTIIFNPGKFAAEMEQFSRGKLVKELGNNIGPRLDAMRTTFRELGKLKDLSYAESEAVLKSLFDDPTTQALARQLGKEPAKTTAEKLLERSLIYAQRASATAPENSDFGIGF